MRALQDWHDLYEAQDAVENDIALLPSTTVVTIDTEYGTEVVAFTDDEVENKKETD